MNREYLVNELSTVKMNDSQSFGELSLILVYYSHTQLNHFVGIYIPSTKYIGAFTVSDKKLSKVNNMVGIKFKKTLEEINGADTVEYEKFDYKHFMQVENAFLEVDKVIKEYKNMNKTAFMTVIHTSTSMEKVKSLGLTSLSGKVPFVHSEARAEENIFPALDWAYFATAEFCKRCVSVDSWVQEKSFISAFSGIPIGNFQPDSMMQMIDVLYSRALISSQHVLWYSDTSLPDLGGNEDCDFRRFFDQLDSNTEMSFPGFYRTQCIEIDITLLCINVIIQSDHIYEIREFIKDSKMEDSKYEEEKLENKISDEIESLESCTTSFLKLKQVVTQWLEDVKKGVKYADVLLSHTYRWLSSGEAKLYDPQLFNFVNNLMQKCFTELTKKIKACGSELIFTSFNKIIIDTKRNDIEQALNYTEYMFETIQSEPMFKYLNFEISKQWAILLYKDRFNYIGLKANSDGKISGELDLANHLPPNLETVFKTTLGIFLTMNYKNILENKNKIFQKKDEISEILDIQKGPVKSGYDDPFLGPYAVCQTFEQ